MTNDRTGGVVRRSPAHRGEVLANRALTPRMKRVTVHSEAMRDLALRPVQDVELLLREPSGRRVKRRYTIRAARPELGELDLDVLLHGHGPGSSWGSAAAAGDEVEFQGPRGKLELRPASWHLLIGDEAALPAIAAIAEALPDDEPAVALVEVDGPADELPVHGADVTWVHRKGAVPGTPELLSRAVTAALTERDLDGARVYVMGESRAAVELRRVLEDAGVDHAAIFVKGYWNIGRPDRLANRPPR